MDRTVPPGAALLLDFIRSIEVGTDDRAGYDIIYGHNQGKLSKPVTRMTVDEVIASQGGWSKRFGSSATGGYQFMKATLSGLKNELSLHGSQLLDPDLQDRLGYHLLKRRGYDAFMAGQISATEFGKRLAMEWASLPVLAPTRGAHRQVPRGSSYYMGDRLNKSLVSPERVETLLVRVKASDGLVRPAEKPQDARQPSPAPERQPKPATRPAKPAAATGRNSGAMLAAFVLIVVAVILFIIFGN